MTARKSITREELEEMLAKHDEILLKQVGEKCESCAQHDCACPARIEELDKATDARMDRLDENDALIQGNIEKVYARTSSDIVSLRDDTTEEIARIRAATDAEIAMLKSATEKKVSEMEAAMVEQDKALEAMRAENNRFANMNLKMVVVMGACVGIMLVMGAVLASMLREGRMLVAFGNRIVSDRALVAIIERRGRLLDTLSVPLDADSILLAETWMLDGYRVMTQRTMVYGAGDVIEEGARSLLLTVSRADRPGITEDKHIVGMDKNGRTMDVML